MTNGGKLHQELTDRLKCFFDVEDFLLFSNGHMALELAIQAFGLQGEVITTPFTFVSTTQAIARNGLTPVFCDIDPVTFNIDPAKIEALINEKTSAIVGVHVYGTPCDVEAIDKIAKKHDLKVIYDAAHAFGVEVNGKSIAQYGDAAMFSFQTTKVFHTVEGGGLAFGNSKHLHNTFAHLRDFGRTTDGMDADCIGANAKMSELHAAMGLCVLRYFDENAKRREEVVRWYDAHLKGREGLQLLPDIDGVIKNHSYYPVIFNEDFGKCRDKICDDLLKQGVMARKYFYPLTSTFSCYQNKFDARDTPIAQKVSERVLCLPLYVEMTREDVDKICNIILNEGC